MTNTSLSIKELEQQARDDLSFTLADISTYAMKVGIYRAKWAKYLYTEENILDDKENLVAAKYRERFVHFTYNSELVIDKKNIDMFIKGDDEYNAVLKEFQEQGRKIKFINEVLNALNSQSFILNTTIKHLIWQSGGDA